MPLAGRRPGTPRYVESGTWLPVAGRPPGSPRHVLGRDARGRYRKIDLGPEARYQWSLSPRLEYLADGSYLYRGRRASAKLVRRLLARGRTDLGPEARWQWSEDPRLEALAGGRYTYDGHAIGADAAARVLAGSRVELAPEAHWRWYDSPPAVTYYRRGTFRINGKPATPGQAQWFIADMQRRHAEEKLPDWTAQDLAPTLDQVGTDEDEGWVDVEVGTDLMKLEDIIAIYGTDIDERRGEAVEDRPVPLERPCEDALEEAERAWRIFEVWLAAQPSAKWAESALGMLISWYVVAHKIVYDEEAVFGEAIVTRFAPVGREGFTELRWRVREMIEKADDDVHFVAAGFRLRIKVLQ